MKAKKMLKKLKPKSDETTPAQPLLTTETGEVKPIVGATTTRKRLRYQANKLSEGALLYKEEMTAAGCRPDAPDQLVAALAKFDATSADRVAAKQATVAYDEAVATAVTFKGKLAAAITVAALNQPEVLAANPLKLHRVDTGYRVAQWFSDVHGVMEILRDDLVKAPPIDWFAELNAREVALNKAIGVYEQHVPDAKERSQKRLVAKNKLVKAIQRVHAYARLAFTGNPAVLKKFQKTAEVRRKAKASELGAGTSAQGGAGASTAQQETAAPPGPTAAPGK